MTYTFPINGLRHHDYGGRLDELYKLAPGRRMSISIEHDNPSESDAVIVYYGKHQVGYVRSGKDREQACSLIKGSGRGAMLGRVVGVDREKRWLWLEVTSESTETPSAESPPTILTNWNFDGKVLPLDEAEQALHTMLCTLEMTLENQEPWEEDMEQWLEYIEQNLWRDISLECYQQITRILGLLAEGSKVNAEYVQKTAHLQIALDTMGCPEIRKLQAMQIQQMADSKEMSMLLLHYGDKVAENLGKLPEPLSRLFMEDSEKLMAKLWYLHRPRKQTQAIKTLLALMVRLKGNGNDGEKAADGISKQWLLAWGFRQKDRAKAEVVQEIIGTFEMEKNNPELAQQVQLMMDGCNAPLQQTELLKEIALRPKTENNFAEGSVSIGTGGTLMGNVNTNIHSNE